MIQNTFVLFLTPNIIVNAHFACIFCADFRLVIHAGGTIFKTSTYRIYIFSKLTLTYYNKESHNNKDHDADSLKF